VVAEDVSYRDGSAADLRTTFALGQRTMHAHFVDQGLVSGAPDAGAAQIDASWARYRSLEEWLDAQERRYVIAEDGDGPLAFARVVRFDGMEELTDLMVDPDQQGTGVGRALLDQVWRGDPSPQLARLVVATGNPRDLSLYTEFGVMPVAGHWHMRVETSVYLGRRSQETDATEAGQVVVLTPERAVAEWRRLEPAALGYDRSALHEFFSRDRTCLATVNQDGTTRALCWVSGDADIGPAVGAGPADVITVVLAALDRVAKSQEPLELGLYVCTPSWHLLHRLRTLGFRVWWPSWIMCSIPLPGLDRYVPTKPPLLL
jgi:GNAT superfamily N-acetyltransferase